MFKNGWIIAHNKGRYLHLGDNKIRMEKISHDKIRNTHFSQNIMNYYTDGHEISGTFITQGWDEKCIPTLSGETPMRRNYFGVFDIHEA